MLFHCMKRGFGCWWTRDSTQRRCSSVAVIRGWYSMVRERVEAGTLSLHGWHYVIEDGEVHVFDVVSSSFMAATEAGHAGT